MIFANMPLRLSGLFSACVLSIISRAGYTQVVVNPDFAFSFDSPDSVNVWQLEYYSPSVIPTSPVFDDGSIAFIPDWQEPDEYMIYVTSLGASYDFSGAFITADVKYSKVYYGGTREQPAYVAGSFITLYDSYGYSAGTRVLGPWGGHAGEFSHHIVMDGIASLDYMDIGFNPKRVEKLGVSIHSSGLLPLAPGEIAYDNIVVGLGNVQNLPEDSGLVDFMLDSARWSSVIGNVISASWNGISSNVRTSYSNANTGGRSEAIEHQFEWFPNLVGGRVSFRYSLPADFEGMAVAVKVQLVDNRDRVVDLRSIDRANLAFDRPMEFSYRFRRHGVGSNSDPAFNIEHVKALRIVVELPDEPYTVSGEFSLSEVRVQARTRFVKNLENPRAE
ncbi:hypothetical protein [Teredinibacter turnerae]|uniref:hypothetical protein n=1 Tax=Teredinibacter turnerae TaxID=2426 RepID=UPI0030CB6F11